jgi:hypothetical protein
MIGIGATGIPVEYGCLCGKRGTRDAIEQHVAENQDGIVEHGSTIDDESFGGNTKAHYMPHEPRVPARPANAEPDPLDDAEWIDVLGSAARPSRPPTPQPLPPVPSGPHAVLEVLPSIAELFQDMLRQAFSAGAAAAVSGETFEHWYQREVIS